MRKFQVEVKKFRQIGALGVGLAFSALTMPVLAQWPQLGGPNRDFKVSTTGLADSWPESGPKEVWSRDLGEGESSISVDGGQLFTLYRDGEHEVVIAMEADSGKTIWEHRYSAALSKEITTNYGEGPHATPAIHNGRVYTLGITGILHCLDQKTGKVVWSHDWVKEFKSKIPNYGFSSSPIAYKNLLIAAVGGQGVGMMAFDLKSGSVAWKSLDSENTYSSPIIINVDGQDQVVLLTDREIVAVSPADGKPIWRFKHENQWKTNISTPVWGKDNLLFVSSSGEAGSRALKLTRSDGKTKVAEVWAKTKLGIGQNNAIRDGDHVYACAGGGRKPFVTAINVKTGEQAWKEDGYKKAQIILGGGKLLLLDETGLLTLAVVTPKAFTVKSTAQVFDDRSWTIPTLVGTRLYMRDKKKIVAFDLG